MSWFLTSSSRKKFSWNAFYRLDFPLEFELARVDCMMRKFNGNSLLHVLLLKYFSQWIGPKHLRQWAPNLFVQQRAAPLRNFMLLNSLANRELWPKLLKGWSKFYLSRVMRGHGSCKEANSLLQSLKRAKMRFLNRQQLGTRKCVNERIHLIWTC